MVDHVDPDVPEEELTPKDNQLPWYKQTELRKLYFMMPFLFLASSTLGFDGSLLNGLQTMDTWQACESVLAIRRVALDTLG